MPQPTPPAGPPPSPTKPPGSIPAPARSNRLRVYAITFLAGLLLGLVPAGIGWYRVRGERNTLQQQLRWANLELDLAAAAVLARHGDYAGARDAASRFFSDAQVELDTRGDTLTPGHRAHLQSVLVERDAIITLLARGDPAGAERATTMYVAYRAAVPR